MHLHSAQGPGSSGVVPETLLVQALPLPAMPTYPHLCPACGGPSRRKLGPCEKCDPSSKRGCNVKACGQRTGGKKKGLVHHIVHPRTHPSHSTDDRSSAQYDETPTIPLKDYRAQFREVARSGGSRYPIGRLQSGCHMRQQWLPHAAAMVVGEHL